MVILCNDLKKSGSRLYKRILWRGQVQGQYVPQQKNRKTEIKDVDLTWALRYKINSFEPLAQSVEHLTFNQVVVGSTPTRLTNLSEELRLFSRTPRFFLIFRAHSLAGRAADS
jgi:hypothetical protein